VYVFPTNAQPALLMRMSRRDSDFKMFAANSRTDLNDAKFKCLTITSLLLDAAIISSENQNNLTICF